MKSVHFPQANITIGATQPQYQPLIAHADENRACTVCFELTEEEKKQIAETGKLWYTQIVGSELFQPIRMSVLNPFEVGLGITGYSDKAMDSPNLSDEQLKTLTEDYEKAESEEMFKALSDQANCV